MCKPRGWRPVMCGAEPTDDVLGSALVFCTLDHGHNGPHEDVLLGRSWRNGDAETTLWLQGALS